MSSDQQGQASQAVLDNIKQAIEKKYPHAEVEISAQPGMISAVVYTQDSRTLESVYARREISDLANRSGGLSSAFYTSMVFYRDRFAYSRRKVLDYIQPPLLQISRNYSVDIEVGVNAQILTIGISCSRDYIDALKDKMNELKTEALKLSGCRRVNVFIRDGFNSGPTLSYTTVEQDDDAPINPNWPSRTGEPSGGGRGNNPPR